MKRLVLFIVVSLGLSPWTVKAAKTEAKPVTIRNGVYIADSGEYCDFLVVRDRSTGKVKKMHTRQSWHLQSAYCPDKQPRLVNCDLHPSPTHLDFCAVKIEGNSKLYWIRILDDSGFALVDDKLEDFVYFFRQ